jgi:hypothetical protein
MGASFHFTATLPSHPTLALLLLLNWSSIHVDDLILLGLPNLHGCPLICFRVLTPIPASSLYTYALVPSSFNFPCQVGPLCGLFPLCYHPGHSSSCPLSSWQVWKSAALVHLPALGLIKAGKRLGFPLTCPSARFLFISACCLDVLPFI